VPFHVAANDPKTGIEKLRYDYTMAHSANRNHGGWHDTAYQVTKPCYVRLWLRKRTSARAGSFGYEQAIVMLRIREDAPVNRIRFSLLNEGNLTAGYTEGTFDIIYYEDYEDAGIPINTSWAEDGDPDYWDGLLTIEQLRKAVSSFRPRKHKELQTESGKTIKVFRRKGRRINLKER